MSPVADPHATHGEALDGAVEAALEGLREAGAPTPRALYSLATGLGVLPDRLRGARSFRLAEVPGVPPPWSELELWTGRLGELELWLLEDVSSTPFGALGSAPWHKAFPLWLAAAAGATVCVHLSAGAALPAHDHSEPPGACELALLTDHVNLSGETPLLGLGESRLGPLFPDLTRLHEPTLRVRASRVAERLGIATREAVAACTVGPTLGTPAERRFMARAGAQVAVQGLAPPLLAAAHAGLGVLACVAVTDAGEGPMDLARLVARTDATAPALDDLVVELAPDVLEVAVALDEELG